MVVRCLQPAMILVALLAFLGGRLLAVETPSRTDAPADESGASLAPFEPLDQRTDSERDRLEAAALFATGRMLTQKQRYEDALRYCQRAHRADPASAVILEQIVSLAIELEREEVASRYALILVELGGDLDLELGRHFARYLGERGELKRAARLYDRLLSTGGQLEPGIAEILEHLNAGRIYLLLERYTDAAKTLELVESALLEPTKYEISTKQARVLSGDAGMTLQLIGVAYLEADRIDDAQRAFRKLQDDHPDATQFGFNMARIAMRRKKANNALDFLQAYLNDPPQDADAAPYTLWVTILQELGREKEVHGELSRLARQQPANAALATVLLRQLLAGDEFLAAAEALDRTNAAAREQGRMLVPELAGLEVDVRLRADQPARLLDLLRAVIRASRSLSGIEDEIGQVIKDKAFTQRIYEEQAKRRRQRDTTEQLQLRAEEAFATAHLALWSGDVEFAEKQFRLAEKLLPEGIAEWWLVWGLELFVKDHAEAAARLLRHAVEQEDNAQRKGVYQFYLASALSLSDDIDGALAAAVASAAADPKSPERAARVAWVYYHGERYDEAVDAYQALIKRFGGDYKSPEARAAVRSARLALSNIYVAISDLSASEEMLQLVLDEFPDDVGAMNDLGYLWADRNVHLNRAFRMILRAVAEDPENLAYLDSLGWVQFRLGRYADAVETLEKAAAGEEADGVILEHLGDAYNGVGQLDKARETWRKALDKFEHQEDSEKAKRIRQKLRAPPPAVEVSQESK
ncbi:MAG: tetratricopeptide repeat protein [Planctomycetales bacterium]|nr:tetratricopeptide repeat protein [Planctomycetales bacterium]